MAAGGGAGESGAAGLADGAGAVDGVGAAGGTFAGFGALSVGALGVDLAGDGGTWESVDVTVAGAGREAWYCCHPYTPATTAIAIPSAMPTIVKTIRIPTTCSRGRHVRNFYSYYARHEARFVKERKVARRARLL